MCDYEAANGVHWQPSQRIAGGHRVRVTRFGPVVEATRSYCSHTHRSLAGGGGLSSGRAIATELAALPELADGKEVSGGDQRTSAA